MHARRCTCSEHFRGSDCNADVDECARPGNECIVGNEACRNVYGSYHCGHCVEGYERDAHELCADVDECARDNGGCRGLQCVNEAGSYRCGQCDEGFRPAVADPSDCEDVDECATENNECQAFYEGLRPCINSEGSYECGDCLAGYFEDPHTSFCTDIDECSVPTRQYCGHVRSSEPYVDVSLFAASYGGVVTTREFSPQQAEIELPLPFRFPFYGELEELAKVSADGYLFFGAGHLTYVATSPIPTDADPNNFIAPLWTDFQECGTLSAAGDSTQWVVEWRVTPVGHACADPAPTAVFQVRRRSSLPRFSEPRPLPAETRVLCSVSLQTVLRPNGDILFSYQAVPVSAQVTSGPYTVSVGVESEDGEQGLAVGYGMIGLGPHGNSASTFPSAGAAVLLQPVAGTSCAAATGVATTWSYPCAARAACTNSVGGHACACEPGFTAGGQQCLATPCTTGVSGHTPFCLCVPMRFAPVSLQRVVAKRAVATTDDHPVLQPQHGQRWRALLRCYRSVRANLFFLCSSIARH